jgi:hypothetical protein
MGSGLVEYIADLRLKWEVTVGLDLPVVLEATASSLVLAGSGAQYVPSPLLSIFLEHIRPHPKISPSKDAPHKSKMFSF